MTRHRKRSTLTTATTIYTATQSGPLPEMHLVRDEPDEDEVVLHDLPAGAVVVRAIRTDGAGVGWMLCQSTGDDAVDLRAARAEADAARIAECIDWDRGIVR